MDRILRKGFVLALIALCFSAGATRRAAADVTGVVWNPTTGHYYKYVDGAIQLAQAKAAAEALGGYLVTYSDLAEIQWTLSNFTVNTQHVWIGGSDIASEGTWAWLNGEPLTYLNWNNLEPNGGTGENYMMMYTNPSASNYGKWNDVYPTYFCNGYFVEWDSDPNPAPPPVIPAPPTNLTATLTIQGIVALAWTDNATTESKYEIERKPSGGLFNGLAVLGVNAVAHDDTTILPLTTYTYRVRSANAVGPSEWSNEASASSGSFAPNVTAPADLVVVDTSSTTADLRWTDQSEGETGFEIHRRKGSGPFAYRFKTAPNATTFHDTGLAPGTEYTWAVRSVGTLNFSGFLEAGDATEPTLVVFSVKGDLKDTPKFARDSLKATAGWAYLGGVSDGAADPVTEGITVRAGGAGAPIVLNLPPNAEGWKGKGAKWKWKNPAGSSAKYQVQVDLEKRLVTVSATGIELAAPPVNPVEIFLSIGNDAGAEFREWAPQKKAGYLRLR